MLFNKIYLLFIVFVNKQQIIHMHITIFKLKETASIWVANNLRSSKEQLLKMVEHVLEHILPFQDKLAYKLVDLINLIWKFFKDMFNKHGDKLYKDKTCTLEHCQRYRTDHSKATGRRIRSWQFHYTNTLLALPKPFVLACLPARVAPPM